LYRSKGKKTKIRKRKKKQEEAVIKTTDAVVDSSTKVIENNVSVKLPIKMKRKRSVDMPVADSKTLFKNYNEKGNRKR